MMHLFRVNRGIGQRRKKPRGALRRALHAAAASEAFARVLDPDNWFNYWHQHLDWNGLGNLSMRFRRIFFAGYARLFRHLAVQGHRLEKPYQLWISLSLTDAGQVAVYLQTPNPNAAHFPGEFSDVHWGGPEVAALFSQWLPDFSIVAGRSPSGFLLLADGYGRSLQAHSQG